MADGKKGKLCYLERENVVHIRFKGGGVGISETVFFSFSHKNLYTMNVGKSASMHYFQDDTMTVWEKKEGRYV